MAMISVKATRMGYYGLQRRREGDRFEVEEELFSSTWMKRVKAQPRDDEDDEVPASKADPRVKGRSMVSTSRPSDQSKI